MSKTGVGGGSTLTHVAKTGVGGGSTATRQAVMPPSREDIVARLRDKLGITEDLQSMDSESFQKLALEGLKTGNATGYHHVRKVENSKKNPFQAMAYVGPKNQRHLGSFGTVEEAAMAVVYFLLDITDCPPTPKERRKRGAGPAPRNRDRRKDSPDRRTSQYRPKKAKNVKRALQEQPAPACPTPALGQWGAEVSGVVSEPIRVWVDGLGEVEGARM